MNECQGGNFGQVCGGLGQTCCVTIDVTPNFCVAPGTTCFGPGLPNAGSCVLCGGDKSRQAKDIAKAKRLAREIEPDAP